MAFKVSVLAQRYVHESMRERQFTTCSLTLGLKLPPPVGFALVTQKC